MKPPRPAGMSRLDLPDAARQRTPTRLIPPAPAATSGEHALETTTESRLRSLELSRERHRGELKNHGDRLHNLEQTYTRRSDFEELNTDVRTQRLSELELEEDMRKAEKARAKADAETWRTRRWAIVMVVVSTGLGVGAKAGCDWWVGSKPQNAPVRSEE